MDQGEANKKHTTVFVVAGLACCCCLVFGIAFAALYAASTADSGEIKQLTNSIDDTASSVQGGAIESETPAADTETDEEEGEILAADPPAEETPVVTPAEDPPAEEEAVVVVIDMDEPTQPIYYGARSTRTVDDGTNYHTFTSQVEGTSLKMKFKSQPHYADPSYKIDDLAWIFPELKLTMAFGLTNDMSLRGTYETGQNWANFSSDDWGHGFYAQYGFQQKRGWFVDSFTYVGPSKQAGKLQYDGLYCNNSEKSCEISFSLDLYV